MMDEFNIVDYFNTIIRFIKNIMNWNKFYFKVSKNLFKGVFKRILNREMNTRTKEVWSPIRLPIYLGQKWRNFQPKIKPKSPPPMKNTKSLPIFPKLRGFCAKNRPSPLGNQWAALRTQKPSSFSKIPLPFSTFSSSFSAKIFAATIREETVSLTKKNQRKLGGFFHLKLVGFRVVKPHEKSVDLSSVFPCFTEG